MIFSIFIYQDMYTEIQIRIKPEQAGVEETLRQIAARVAGVGAERICRVDIVRKSIDARQKEVMFNLVAGLHIDRIEEKEKVFVPAYRDVSDRETVACRFIRSFAFDRTWFPSFGTGKGKGCRRPEKGFEWFI